MTFDFISCFSKVVIKKIEASKKKKTHEMLPV